MLICSHYICTKCIEKLCFGIARAQRALYAVDLSWFAVWRSRPQDMFSIRSSSRKPGSHNII